MNYYTITLYTIDNQGNDKELRSIEKKDTLGKILELISTEIKFQNWETLVTKIVVRVNTN